jgi:putative cardiolipin synthase
MSRRNSPVARFALGVALAAVLAACATPAPPPRLTLPESRAAAPAPGGLLADIEEGIRAKHGPGRSGFGLLDANEDGLRWRIALVDSARHTLDIQYYVWWADESGELLMRRIVQAADRGVRVRLVVDDLTTLLEDEAHPRIRDAGFLRVDAHPNISVRYFNAWRERSMAGRAVEMIERMERLNHRMHNKLLVADNRAAVIGGRNVGNEYFGLSPHFNFRDLDVLGVGPVARQASAVFDAFWNSGWVVPARKAAPDGGPDAGEAAARRLATSPIHARFPPAPKDWRAEMEAFAGAMHGGTSRVHTDRPDGEQLKHHMPAAIRALMQGAKREVLVSNAYIIPDERSVENLRGITSRGVRVRVLTNSLASHDVPAVNSHYKPWRRPLIDAGVELHEMRHDAAVQPLLADTPPVKAGFMGLHVKAMVIDRERVFIGSMNLDPRSAELNSEMGVIVDSPGLAGELAASLDRDMSAPNAWRVTLADDGGLLWSDGRRFERRQPARGFWQRVEDVFFMAFPRDLY